MSSTLLARIVTPVVYLRIAPHVEPFASARMSQSLEQRECAL